MSFDFPEVNARLEAVVMAATRRTNNYQRPLLQRLSKDE
jgi:hypothetical protein